MAVAPEGERDLAGLQWAQGTMGGSGQLCATGGASESSFLR